MDRIMGRWSEPQFLSLPGLCSLCAEVRYDPLSVKQAGLLTSGLSAHGNDTLLDTGRTQPLMASRFFEGLMLRLNENRDQRSQWPRMAA